MKIGKIDVNDTYTSNFILGILLVSCVKKTTGLVPFRCSDDEMKQKSKYLLNS